jgi:hypothetical protein
VFVSVSASLSLLSVCLAALSHMRSDTEPRTHRIWVRLLWGDCRRRSTWGGAVSTEQSRVRGCACTDACVRGGRSHLCGWSPPQSLGDSWGRACCRGTFV